MFLFAAQTYATINAEQQIRSLADRYHPVDSERAVSQWRLSRHILNGFDTTSFTETYTKIPVDQGWANYGPRAACGPATDFILRPARAFINKT